MKKQLQSIVAGVFGALLMALLLKPVEATYVAIPTGAISYFNASSCPAGWTEFTTARGLYIVGRVSAGTLATAVGSALTNQEARNHTHGVTGSVGAGSFGINAADHSFVWDNGAGGFSVIAAGAGGSAPTIGAVVTGNTGNQSTGIAPYLQLLVCSKS